MPTGVPDKSSDFFTRQGKHSLTAETETKGLIPHRSDSSEQRVLPLFTPFHRILLEKQTECLVHLRVDVIKQPWLFKKDFTQNSKKLGRRRRAIAVQSRFRMRLKIRVGRGKYVGPGPGVRALMLGRKTVCCAVQHIQLVDKLVDDHVVPIQCACGFGIFP